MTYPLLLSTYFPLVVSHTEYQGKNRNVTFVPGVTGQAIHLTGSEHIDIRGIPQNFWSSPQWTVVALVKIGEKGLGSNKEIALLGDGDAANSKGFHLGFRDRVG